MTSGVIDVRNLNRAASQLFSVAGHQEVPDIINFRDVQPFWREYRNSLLEDLDRSYFGPSYVEIIEHPKNPIAVRPIARFSIRDRLVYDALAATVADSIEPLLSDGVYSYRASKERRHSIQAWVAMRREARKTLTSGKLQMARTDIASFYEHIDIDILAMDLKAIDVDSATVEHLSAFLRNFSQQSHACGLPQGSTASGILANTYLLPIDEWLRQSGVQYLRYSDDIYLFASERECLRSTLLGANRALRARKLSMSAVKTEIFSKGEAGKFLDDANKDMLSYFLDLGKPWALKELRNLFSKAIGETPLNERDIKFSLPRLAREWDCFAQEWVVDNLQSSHHLSNQMLRYMERISSGGRLKSLLESLIDAMPSSDYPYLERNIFHCAIRANVRSELIKEFAWLVLRDRNRQNLPREFAARYIGCFGAPPDGQLLKMEYESEDGEYVRRSLLVAMYEVGYESPAMLRDLTRSSSDLKWTAEFLLSGPEVPRPK